MRKQPARNSGNGTGPRLELAVQYATRGHRLPSREQLRRWARAALERNARVTVRLKGLRRSLVFAVCRALEIGQVMFRRFSAGENR